MWKRREKGKFTNLSWSNSWANREDRCIEIQYPGKQDFFPDSPAVSARPAAVGSGWRWPAGTAGASGGSGGPAAGLPWTRPPRPPQPWPRATRGCCQSCRSCCCWRSNCSGFASIPEREKGKNTEYISAFCFPSQLMTFPTKIFRRLLNVPGALQKLINKHDNDEFVSLFFSISINIPFFFPLHSKKDPSSLFPMGNPQSRQHPAAKNEKSRYANSVLFQPVLIDTLENSSQGDTSNFTLKNRKLKVGGASQGSCLQTTSLDWSFLQAQKDFFGTG